MQRASVLLLLVGLVAIVGASRLPVDPDPFPSVLPQGRLGVEQYLHQRRNRAEEEGPGYLAVKFIVKPGQAEEFEKYWRSEVYPRVSQEKGNKCYGLKKTFTDNIVYISYGEWESCNDVIEHIKSEPVQNFFKFADEKDLVYCMHPLESVTDREVMPSRNHRANAEEVEVLYKFLMPPSEKEDFIGAWERAVRGVEGEEGAIKYALRGHKLDNAVMCVAGAWKDWQAYQDHLQADHTQKLLGHLADRGIVFFRTTVRCIATEK